MDDEDNFASTTVAAGQLKAIVERVERLEEEKKEIADQIKEVYAEAKANGFDTKTLRKVVSLRKKAAEERQEEEAMLDLYLHALGMIPEPSQ
ncbi:MAG: GapR family DNA-binding domain-containing protein [Pseudomonadota bacterium]